MGSSAMSALCQKQTFCAAAVGYSITSSARVSTDGVIVRPSAFAVFRFTTSSYLVGHSTSLDVLLFNGAGFKEDSGVPLGSYFRLSMGFGPFPTVHNQVFACRQRA